MHSHDYILHIISILDDENSSWPYIEFHCIQWVLKFTAEFCSLMYHVSFTRKISTTVKHTARGKAYTLAQTKKDLEAALIKLENTEW
jgi:hypothetical protein